MPLPTTLATTRKCWQVQLQNWAADGSLASAASPRPREWWKFPGDLNPGYAGVERTPH